MITATRHALACAFRRAALPLSCYYAITLLLPVANGAAASGAAFADHALVVAVVPPIVVVLLCAVRGVTHMFARSAAADWH